MTNAGEPDFCRINQFENLHDFIYVANLPVKTVVLFILQHEKQIEDHVLRNLFPWSSVDFTQISGFKHQGARTTWCISRILHRAVLSSITGLLPSELPLCVGAFGKPYLKGSEICFNIAHSMGCVLLAVSRGLELGCDIEDSEYQNQDCTGIANEYFLKKERDWIEQANDYSARKDRFLTLFVEKEARLKAMGIGLTFPLNRVETVMMDPPFQFDSIFCFRYGENDRYLIALSVPDSTSVKLEIRAHQFRVGSCN